MQNFRAACTTNFLSSFQNPWKDSQLPNKGIISHLKMETSTFENTTAMAFFIQMQLHGYSSAFPCAAFSAQACQLPKKKLIRVLLKSYQIQTLFFFDLFILSFLQIVIN
jgi:hypothetical protein